MSMCAQDARTSFSALYVHLPFCAKRCAYCTFYTSAASAKDSLIDAYTQALVSQIERLQRAGFLSELKTAYLGGGTPTLLGAKRLSVLVSTIAKSARLKEFTFEANPESTTPELLAAARAAGATRISLGVQSLDASELKLLGRIHTAERAEVAISTAQAAGLSVSADLMAALPGQSTQTLEATISHLLALGPDHISLYPLEIYEGTPLDKAINNGLLPDPTTDEQAAAMILAARLFEAAGYTRYEVASYAKPGAACLHNQAYWQGTNYLGLGTSAASMASRALYQEIQAVFLLLPNLPPDITRARFTVSSTPAELAQTGGNPEEVAFEVEGLTTAQAAAEDLMLAARTTRGVSRQKVEEAAGLLPHALDALAKLTRQGYLQETPDAWVPTTKGWLLGNVVFEALWELAPSTETWFSAS